MESKSQRSGRPKLLPIFEESIIKKFPLRGMGPRHRSTDFMYIYRAANEADVKQISIDHDFRVTP